MFIITEKNSEAYSYGDSIEILDENWYLVLGQNSVGKVVLIGEYLGSYVRQWVISLSARHIGTRKIFSNAYRRGNKLYYEVRNCKKLSSKFYAIIDVNLHGVLSYSDDIRGDFGILTIGNSVKKRYLQLFDWVMDAEFYHKDTNELIQKLSVLGGVGSILLNNYEFKWEEIYWGGEKLSLEFYNLDYNDEIYKFRISVCYDKAFGERVIYCASHWMLNRRTGELTVPIGNNICETTQLKHKDSIDLRYTLFT